MRLQLLPHAPQLLALLATAVSQPSSGKLLPQLAKPLAQATGHLPLVQLGIAPVAALAVEQTLPHCPHAAAVVTGVSHPVESIWSQLPKPELHSGPHTPLGQPSVAFG